MTKEALLRSLARREALEKVAYPGDPGSKEYIEGRCETFQRPSAYWSPGPGSLTARAMEPLPRAPAIHPDVGRNLVSRVQGDRLPPSFYDAMDRIRRLRRVSQLAREKRACRLAML